MRTLTRRSAIGYIAAAVLSHPRSSRAFAELYEAKKPFGWLEFTFGGRTVYQRGTADRVVVLLHELNGMSPGCIDLGVKLVDSGFTVFMPLLFGHPVQDSVVLGFIESCGFGHFRCFSNGGPSEDSRPVTWTRKLVEDLCGRVEIRSIGLIGMCQTGAFPLAAMTKGSKVKGVVMSQPALPMGNAHQKNVGIADSTMRSAKESGIPILAFRFNGDRICTAHRFKFLKSYFGSEQFRSHAFDCVASDASMSHPLHAVLTGPCGTVREEARTEAIEFLSEKLGRDQTS